MTASEINPIGRGSCTPGATAAERMAALRILDANFNRACEGLRVVEEYCRFSLGDRHLTERCKTLRHALVTAVNDIPKTEFLAARETQTDVGTTVSTEAEFRRSSLAQTAAANWQRVLEALRSLEEYSKLLSATVAGKIESLRYTAYTLSKATAITADARERLAAVRLYVLIDGSRSECAYVERVQELVAAGVHAIQLRDKSLDDRALLARGGLLRRVLDERDQDSTLLRSVAKPLFIMNDRPDLAVLARADGVHVGQEELPVHDVRQIVGPKMLVGVSTHNIQQARQAVLDGASYIGCGPTFPSETKQFDQFPGLDFLRLVAGEISLPAFAIGGITLENFPQVLKTRMTRVAVRAALNDATDVRATVAEFLAALPA